MNNPQLLQKIELLLDSEVDKAEKIGKELISQFIINKDKDKLEILCKKLGRSLYTYYLNLFISDLNRAKNDIKRF